MGESSLGGRDPATPQNDSRSESLYCAQDDRVSVDNSRGCPTGSLFRSSTHDQAWANYQDFSANLQCDRFAQVNPRDRIRYDCAIHSNGFLLQLSSSVRDRLRQVDAKEQFVKAHAILSNLNCHLQNVARDTTFLKLFGPVLGRSFSGLPRVEITHDQSSERFLHFHRV